MRTGIYGLRHVDDDYLVNYSNNEGEIMSTQADLRKVIEDYQWTWTDFRPGEDSDMDEEIKQRVDAILQAVNAYITATCEQTTQDAILAGQISVLKGLDHDYRNHTIDLPTLILELIDDYTEQRRTLARLTGGTK